MSVPFDNMTSFEKDLLLLFFKQYMTMHQRREMMTQLPRAYNRFVQQDVMQVTNTSTETILVKGEVKIDENSDEYIPRCEWCCDRGCDGCL